MRSGGAIKETENGDTKVSGGHGDAVRDREMAVRAGRGVLVTRDIVPRGWLARLL